MRAIEELDKMPLEGRTLKTSEARRRTEMKEKDKSA